MKRLFEHKRSGSPELAQEQPTAGRAQLQSAIDAALGDDSTRKLGALLGEAQAVAPVQYTRERHGRWLVEHGRAGNDYVFQLHPLKAPSRPWQDIVTGLIAAMDSVFPRTVPIQYRRPDEEWQVKFFTISVTNVCLLPGWEIAVKRATDLVGNVDAWARAGSGGDAR